MRASHSLTFGRQRDQPVVRSFLTSMPYIGSCKTMVFPSLPSMSVTTGRAQTLSTRNSASKFLTFLTPKTLRWLDMGLVQHQRPTWLMRTVVFFGGATDTCRVKRFGLESRSRSCWTIEEKTRQVDKKVARVLATIGLPTKISASPPAACFECQFRHFAQTRWVAKR